MEWLKELIKSNPFASLLLPTALSGFSFFGSFFLSLSDGVIDKDELTQLVLSANGLETLLLVIIMLALKNEK